MAVKAEQKSKLVLQVQTGVTAAGAPAYKQRTFANINPELGDEDFLTVAAALGTLQAHSVHAVHRQDTGLMQKA